MPNSKECGKMEERNCIFEPLGALEGLGGPRITKMNYVHQTHSLLGRRWISSNSSQHTRLCHLVFVSLLFTVALQTWQLGLKGAKFHFFPNLFPPVHTFFCFVLKIVMPILVIWLFSCLLPYTGNWICWSSDYPKARQKTWKFYCFSIFF